MGWILQIDQITQQFLVTWNEPTQNINQAEVRSEQVFVFPFSQVMAKIC